MEFGALRDVWPHEAWDFTVWLQENIEALEERIGIGLCDAEREQACGSFSVDLVARDKFGHLVVIENQLQRTDHDHLGKLLTYMSMLEASTAIWVAADFRPEHIRAISWLNDSTPGNFYLVKVEAVRIDGSIWAPLFTVLEQPSVDLKAASGLRSDNSNAEEERFDFWSGLIEMASAKSQFHARLKPRSYHFLKARSLKYQGVYFEYVLNQSQAWVGLYLDKGKTYNEAVFDELFEQREAIERESGLIIKWDRLNHCSACRISTVFDEGIKTMDRSDWPRLQEGLVGAMTVYEQVFDQFLPKAISRARDAEQAAAYADNID